MAVWETTTYKVDIAKEVYETCPTLFPRVFGRTVTPYLQPRGQIVPIEDGDTWEELALVCNWDPIPDDADFRDQLDTLTAKVTNWSIGTGAIYKLIHAKYKGDFDVRHQYPYDRMDKYAKALASVVSGPSLITPSAFVHKWDKVDEKILNLARLFDDFSEGWKYFARNMRPGKKEYHIIDQSKFFGDGIRIYYGAWVGNVVILVGSSYYTNRGLILTKTHVDMLIEASARISCLLDHVAREHVDDAATKERIMGILDQTIVDAGKARGENVYKVVQGFQKARAYMQMRLFDNVMRNSLHEALLEFQGSGLQTVIHLPNYIACFEGLPKGRWLELLHVYKWMPPPDFDSTYAFTDLQELHMSPRLSGLNDGSTPYAKELWRLIVKERKLNIAVAYHNIHKDWPADLEILDGSPTEESLDSWKPKGLFPYHTYGTDISAQVKDKTTVLADIRDEIRLTGREPDKNFLLWFLRNDGKVDTRVDAMTFMKGRLKEDNYVRVAYKGEAHKPGSRLFYMAPPRQRILLGEMEGNIARIASQYPASLQGMDVLKKAERLEHLFNVNDLDFGIAAGIDFTCYVVTFDLAKFSTRFNGLVLKDLHEFWADVFTYEPLRTMYRIGGDSVVLHTTNNLVMQYTNKGADLEGFRGRMMTLFHADLIAAACRKALELGYIVGKAVTAVFIDDGAVRIAAKGKGSLAKTNALNFLKVMQDVYAAAGQENHPNKTIVSQIGGELLAEQYLHGQRLKCPIKAGMRLYPDYNNPAASIAEEFDAMFATCQGAVKDGGDWVVAYRRLGDAYIKAIMRWTRGFTIRMDAVRVALKLILPKSLGGFGFPSLQALTSTTTYDMTSEGLGMLAYTAKVYPAYSHLIQTLMDRPVVTRAPLQILRDPGRVRMVGPVIIEGRITTAILDRLAEKRGPWRNLVENYRNAELVNHATQVAICALSADSVSFPVLRRIWDCTPLAFVEGIIQKFKRSGSITVMLGERTIISIRNKNRRDVKNILLTFVPT